MKEMGEEYEEKNKTGETTLLSIKVYYKATVNRYCGIGPM